MPEEGRGDRGGSQQGRLRRYAGPMPQHLSFLIDLPEVVKVSRKK